MLHPQYLKAGSRLPLPDVANCIGASAHDFIVKAVHAGGMGICVRVAHEASRKEYALKSVLPEFIGDQQAVDRFYDELHLWYTASTCGLIAEATGIIRINHSPTVVAPWLAGGDLSHRLARMTTAEKLEALLRITRALSWALVNLGVIHRDLKPANVLTDEHGSAFVADWGLARPITLAMERARNPVKDEHIVREDRTAAGSFMGTIMYAAPEQILGSKALDHRADIYALGCMMYEMETGLPPFVGTTVQEIARLHLRAKPDAVGGFFSRGSLGLANVIARCLEKDPAKRFQTYPEIETALLKCMKSHGGLEGNCAVTLRQKRNVLGQGSHKLLAKLQKATKLPHDPNFGVVDIDKLRPYLHEADNLMGLNRFSEAAKLLEPLLGGLQFVTGNTWTDIHTTTLNYAYCLTRIDGRLIEALQVFSYLATLIRAPDAFYINYSLALQKAGRDQEAYSVTSDGLRQFPDDPDLVGNHTIACLRTARLEEAHSSALRRLTIRRDVNSLEEAAYVLTNAAELTRNSKMPESFELIKSATLFIREALAINPRVITIWDKLIRVYLFAEHGEPASELCEAIYNSSASDRFATELALCRMLRLLKKPRMKDAFVSFSDAHRESLQVPSCCKMFEAEEADLHSECMLLAALNRKSIPYPTQRIKTSILRMDAEGYEHPLAAAKYLAATGKVSDVLDIVGLETENWEIIRVRIIALMVANMLDEAASDSEQATLNCIHQADAWDLAAEIYKRKHDAEKAVSHTRAGESYFKNEMSLIEDLRQFLDEQEFPAYPA